MPPVRKPPARMSREAGGAGQAGRAGIAAKKGKRTNGELEKGRRAAICNLRPSGAQEAFSELMSTVIYVNPPEGMC